MTIEAVLQHNIRPHLFGLKPYSSARDDFKGQADTWLDANENPFTKNGDFNRYPDPHQRALKEKVGKLKNVDVSEIFLGNGSDEAIDLLYKATCTPGVSNVIICPPTYGMYAVQAGIFGVEVREAPLDADFQLVTDRVLAQIDESTRLIWLCSPNNPTGNLLNRSIIETILSNTRALVVVDEAYIDFANESSVWHQYKNQYPNLIVLQTFSKAWGMAGLRLGVLLANPQIVGLLYNIKLPYNINTLTQQLALEQLANVTQKETEVAAILMQRRTLANQLLQTEGILRVYDSQANYLLFKVKEPILLYRFLAENGVVIRDRSTQPGCEGCLRVTIGTQEENERFISFTTKFLTQNGR